jgi:ribose transport system substrate-binding protein
LAKTKNLYLIPVLSKALDILELLQNENEPMTLEAIHRRTRVSKTTVYRVLKTFVHRGYLAQAPDGTYRHVARRRKMRFGFAGQSAEMPFSNEVTRSLNESALALGVELIVLDNHYDGATAVKNAEELIRSGVDLIFEFNVAHEVAPEIGHRIAEAGIPLIAIDIPHPNAIFFGVDNYRAGMDAGELLARYAAERWAGKVDWVLGLDLPAAGTLVQGRVSGAFEAVRATLPGLAAAHYIRLDGKGQFETSRKLVGDFLDRHPPDRHSKDKRILIAAATDTSALGAAAAVRERRRVRHVAIVGQDCIAEAVAEMNRAETPLIGTVSHEISTYGPTLMSLALELLKGQPVAPYNYVTHRVVERPVVRVVERVPAQSAI